MRFFTVLVIAASLAAQEAATIRGTVTDESGAPLANAKITMTPGGMLERILGKRETMVNSIHRQGIKKLAPGLTAEAVAPDGIIEAVSVKGAKAFAFGAQWHPEFKAAGNPDSVKLFGAFGDAVRAHGRARSQDGAASSLRYA
jgi:putative glutamine amidotransferase